MVLAADFTTSDVFLGIFFFFAMVIWVFLIISIFADIVRSDDLSGWGRAGWLLLVIVVPLAGAFVYFVVRGFDMSERQYYRAQARGNEPTWMTRFY